MDERFKNKYMDTNCLTHVLPYTFSENGILFTAYMRYLNLVKEIEALHAIYSTVNRDVQSDTYWFDPQPYDKNKKDAHFSKDNMLGLYYMKLSIGLSVDKLPVFYWNEDKSRHPLDVLFFAILHRPWIFKFVKFLLWKACKISCKKPRKDTSGKLKWLLRWECLRIIGLSVSKYESKMVNLLEKEHGEKPISDVLEIYFTKNGEYKDMNPDHPILIKIREEL